MDAGTIFALVLGGIGSILGVINQFWGSGILSRRQKVIVRDPLLKVSLVETDRIIERIFIQNSFKLVRVRGEQDLHLETAYLQLSITRCEKLVPYFKIPSEGRVYWEGIILYGDESNFRTIQINKPLELQIRHNLNSRGILRQSDDKMREHGLASEIDKKLAIRVSLKSWVPNLETKYMIVWIDGTGKEWRYKLPGKWWTRFLPEWVWWRIG